MKRVGELKIISEKDRKFVCKNCFNDYGIKDFIQKNPTNNNCSYCANELNGDSIAIPLAKLIEFILTCIKTEWIVIDLNQNGMLNANGHWELACTSTSDLLHGIGLNITDKKLYDDILHLLPDKGWNTNPIGFFIDTNKS